MSLDEKEKELLRQYNSCKSDKKRTELVRALKRVDRKRRLEERSKGK